MQVKQQLIDEVFKKAKENLQKISDEDYLRLISDMLIKSVVTGNEEVIISKRDRRRISSDFLAKLMRNLKNGSAGES